ncbi:myb-binding protein 1A-like protein [Ruditapes philippinarum]|uniref:myb-binding protein 1A-like protein n=1 Tax=Ruditapes philippinarum TaxID=129788 RepID=UPI00295AA65A|nr:myb-binding protein 1A-like protein [Ruditapes philippinarum]
MCTRIEMENLSENSQRKLPERNILDLFVILTKSGDVKRCNATKCLLDHLQKQQASSGKNLCGDVKYTIKRLVQGLSSDRKYTRVGFSTALCQLLRTVDTIASSDVLSCIAHSADNTAKNEERNVFLGNAFGLLTLINSGKILTASSGEISDIVDKLLQLYNKKTYLQLLCLNGILQIIMQVSHDVFKNSVLPHLQQQYATGWDVCTPDTLQLLLTSCKYHPASVKKFLKDHWLGDQLISEKNFPHLGTVVLKSTSLTHMIHPLIDELLAVVKEKHLDVGKFWKHVGKTLLASDRRVRVGPKQILGLYLLEKILPLIDTPEKLKAVMLPDIGSVLIQLCSKKMEEGTKGAKKISDVISKITQVLTALVELTVASKDAQFQLEMLKCLISPPGSFEFDNQTNTTTIAQISSQLLPEAKHEYIEELMKAFRGEPSWIASENQSASLPQWCVKQLCLMCGNTESSWQLKIFQFLFLHSFFTVKKYSKDIPHN